MSGAMYNILAIFCITACILTLIGCWFALEDEIAKKVDRKCEQRRAKLRKDPKSQIKYRGEYWIRRNRENLWEEIESEKLYHVK